MPTRYDDGGLSGGTMERPALQALQALLAEIRAGQVDVIVVYKVDRLTRSLADFAKMVELFDATGASFVAVTQQFNTTTSMGRLTLNVLLSFAQFEREVTGERIRDKIAASKRKGMWVGDRTPLGYVVRDRKLVVEAADAAMVVHLYQRYLALGCVRRLKAELDQQGIVSQRRTDAGGRGVGGTPYSRGALYVLLSNPVYLGQVRHKGECHPGQHEAIVPMELYAAVQERLASSSNGGRGRQRAKLAPSLLAGKLFDAAGERLVPTHARKGGLRYRYYVSATLLAPRSRCGDEQSSAGSGWRLPALEMEQAVVGAMATVLSAPSALVPDALAAGLPAAEVPGLLKQLATINSGSESTLQSVLQRVELSAEGMMLTLTVPGVCSDQDGPGRGSNLTLRRFVSHRMRRRGVEMRLVLNGGPVPTRDDPALLKIVARAHCWFEDLVGGRFASAHELAQALGVTSRYVQRLLPLALLAPSLVEQIASGRHDPALTAETLSRCAMLPLRWSGHAVFLNS